MTPLFLAYALVCGAVLVALWWSGNAAILDPGGYTQPDFADEFRHPPADKMEHAALSALATVGGLACNGWRVFWPVVLVLVLGALWEAGQRWPRHPYPNGKPGFADWRDVLADAVGALVVAVVVLAVRAVVR